MEDEDAMPLGHDFKFYSQRTFPLGGDYNSHHHLRSSSTASKLPRSLYGNSPWNGGERSSLCSVSREGDIIWAKVFPHSWRPGKVQSFNGSLISVSFFGYCRTLSLDPSDICGFEESFPQMINMAGVKLSHEINLALNDFAWGIATGLECNCRFSLADEKRASATKSGFNPLEIIDFLIEKAVSPQAADEEIATVVRISSSIIAFRHALDLCKSSEVDEKFCVEKLLGIVGDVATCQCTDDKEIDEFDKAVCQLKSFRRFIFRKSDGFFQHCWEFKKKSFKCSNVQAYQGQTNYTSEDEMYHEMTKDPVVDVSVELHEQDQMLKMNHEKNREMCVTSMMDFSIFCMEKKFDSQIDDRNQVDVDRGHPAGSDVCRNTKHENILHCTEDSPVNMENGAEVHSNKKISSLVNDTNEIAASSNFASVHDKFVITPLLPNHKSTNMHVCSDKYSVVDVSVEPQEEGQLLKMNHEPIREMCVISMMDFSIFCMDKNSEYQIYDRDQVDVDCGQSSGSDTCISTKHENILHSFMEDPPVNNEIGAKFHGYKISSLVNDTNETATSSICASVHDKFFITPPLPSHLLHVAEEFTFNKSIDANLETAKHESTDMHVCSNKYNFAGILSSAKNLLQCSFSINNESSFFGVEEYQSQICDQYQVDSDQGQSAGNDTFINTKDENIRHLCLEGPPVNMEVGFKIYDYKNYSLVNDTAVSSFCPSVDGKLVITPPFNSPDHMLQVVEEFTINKSIAANLENAKHESTDMHVCSDRYNYISPSLTYPNHTLKVGEETSIRSMVENLENLKVENTHIPEYSDTFNSVDILSSAENKLQQASGGQLPMIPINNGCAFSPSNLNLANEPQSRSEVCFIASNTAQCVNEISHMVPLEKTALLSLAKKRKVYETTIETFKLPKTSALCFDTSAHSRSLMGKNTYAQVSNWNNKALSYDNVETNAIKFGSCYEVNVSCKLNNSHHISKSSHHNYHHQSQWQAFYAAPLVKNGLPTHENRKSFGSNNCRTPTKNLTVKDPKYNINRCTPKKKPSIKFPKYNRSSSTPKKLLNIKFPKNYTLPSVNDLEKKLAIFGQLDHRKTRVFFYTGVGQVVFLHQADAIVAHSYVTKNGIFGQANMISWLSKAENYNKENSKVPSAVPSSQNVKSCLKPSIPQLNDKRIIHRVRFSTDH